MTLAPGDNVVWVKTKSGDLVALPAVSPNTAGNKCLFIKDVTGKTCAIKLSAISPGDKVLFFPDKSGHSIAVKCGGIAPNPPDSWALFYEFAVHGGTIMEMEPHGDHLFWGMYDDPVYSYKPGEGFTPVVDYGAAGPYHWSLKSASDGYLYYSYGYASGVNCGIARSATGTSSWVQVHDTGSGWRMVRSIQEHGGNLYAALHDYTGAGHTEILKSSDGATWNTIYTSADNKYFMGLRSFGAYLYAQIYQGTSNELWRSTNGAVWSLASTTVDLMIGSFGSYAYGVGDVLGSYTKLYRSSNGTVWTEVQDLGIKTPYCFCEHEGLLFIGAGALPEIWCSEDNGATWVKVYEPTTYYSNNFLDIGVYNNRIWGATETALYRSAEIK